MTCARVYSHGTLPPSTPPPSTKRTLSGRRWCAARCLRPGRTSWIGLEVSMSTSHRQGDRATTWSCLSGACVRALSINHIMPELYFGKNFNRRNSANVHHHSAVAVKTDRLRHQKPLLEVAPTTKNSTIKQQACSPTQQLRCRCRHLVKSTKHNAVLDSKNEYPVSSCGHWPAISLFELVLGKP